MVCPDRGRVCSAHNEPEQNGGSAGNGSKASADPEAQALREKALKALHSLKSMDASNGNDADADAASLEKEQTGGCAYSLASLAIEYFRPRSAVVDQIW